MLGCGLYIWASDWNFFYILVVYGQYDDNNFGLKIFKIKHINFIYTVSLILN